MGFAALWVVAGLVMAVVVQSEQEELFDLALRNTAAMVHPILVERLLEGEATMSGMPVPTDPDEALVYLLLDREGRVLLQSEAAAEADLPQGLPDKGYVTTATHRFYRTGFDAGGTVVAFGQPLSERAEAYRQGLAGFLLPMIALLPLIYLMVGWIARRSLLPLDAVGSEIAKRDDGRLNPVPTNGMPYELRGITDTVNGLMLRLGQSLEAERNFATNAAHELRTPVALALAQVQRLKAEGGGNRERIDRIEAALQRMSRLVTRLLDLARAEAGIGATDRPEDLAALLRHVIGSLPSDPARIGHLTVRIPDAPVHAWIDADAFAILARNLIDNALRHAPDGADILVDLSPDGVLLVENDAPALTSDEMEDLAKRYRRGGAGGNGFGVGLHIADTIARGVGGRLDLRSPRNGQQGGFSARFQASPDSAATKDAPSSVAEAAQHGIID